MPIFIEGFALERLEAVAQVEGLIAKALPEILFICVRNAGRSQMAAALAHELSRGRVVVRSAGSDPAETIHPVVVEAMREIGIDVRMEFPKPLTDGVVRAADVVVTLGCGDACPILPGKRYEDWEVADPAGQPLEVVRRIRDDIYHHVVDLLESLGAQVPGEPGAT
jgi:arsenate reductase (thioredoxin)